MVQSGPVRDALRHEPVDLDFFDELAIFTAPAMLGCSPISSIVAAVSG